MNLGNTPRSTTVFALEARKSFALGLQFKTGGLPLVLTGSTVRLVVAKPKHQGGTVVIDRDATLVDADLGLAQFELQAADLDLAEVEHPFVVTFVSAAGYSTPVLKGVFAMRDNPDPDDLNVYAGVNPSTNLAVSLESGGVVEVNIASVDGLSVAIDERIVTFTAEAIVLRDQAAASATAAAAAATTASASATSAAASASVAQTVASGATDAILSGILNDESSQSRATLDQVVADEVAANPASDGVVAGHVGDAGSATQLAVDARAAAAVDAIDHDTEMTSVLSNPASDAKMLLELEYGHASSITVSPDGGLGSTNVQDALEELDAEKAAAGHTHAYVQSVTAAPGGGATVDNTDPANPKVSLAGNLQVFRGYASANLNIAHNEFKVIPLNTESFDPVAMHDLVIGPTIVTIQQTGYYQVNARVAVSSTSGYSSLYLYKNGLHLRGDDAISNGTTGAVMKLSDVIYLAAGEYLELAATQRSGTTVAVLGGVDSTFLSLARVGG